MVQSLVRAMEALGHLRKADKSCSLTESSQMSGLPPSTVHRILQILYSVNYVSRDPKTHPYRLSTALISLGTAATRRLRLSGSAKPVLKDLMEVIKEDAFPVIMSGCRGIVLEEVEGPNPLKVIERFSNETDLHYDGSRRALLTFQSDSLTRGYIQEHLHDEPRSTPEEEERSLNSLLRIRKEEVTISRGEYILDVVGTGAPVFDMNGKAVASIGLIVPQSRTSRAQGKEFEILVKQHVAQLSTLLGLVQKR